jgi:hypothetical protein
MMVKKIIIVHFKNYTKHINIFCGKIAEIFNVKADDIYTRAPIEFSQRRATEILLTNSRLNRLRQFCDRPRAVVPRLHILAAPELSNDIMTSFLHLCMYKKHHFQFFAFRIKA